MKEAYHIIIHPHKGRCRAQHLTLSEINLLPEILRENKQVNISRVELTEREYFLIFNK